MSSDGAQQAAPHDAQTDNTDSTLHDHDRPSSSANLKLVLGTSPGECKFSWPANALGPFAARQTTFEGRHDRQQVRNAVDHQMGTGRGQPLRRHSPQPGDLTLR